MVEKMPRITRSESWTLERGSVIAVTSFDNAKRCILTITAGAGGFAAQLHLSGEDLERITHGIADLLALEGLGRMAES